MEQQINLPLPQREGHRPLAFSYRPVQISTPNNSQFTLLLRGKLSVSIALPPSPSTSQARRPALGGRGPPAPRNRARCASFSPRAKASRATYRGSGPEPDLLRAKGRSPSLPRRLGAGESSRTRGTGSWGSELRTLRPWRPPQAGDQAALHGT